MVTKNKGFRYIENDSLFQDLSKKLDICSAAHDDCEDCPLLNDCRKFFDWLSDRAGDKVLKPEDRQWFESRYQQLFTQLNLFEGVDYEKR